MTAPSTLRPLRSIEITSPIATPSFLAVAGLTSAALSQVSFVIGSGVSCSQALFDEPAVEDRPARHEDHFIAARRQEPVKPCRTPELWSRPQPRRRGRITTVMQRLSSTPSRRRQRRQPVIPNDVVGLQILVAGDERNQFGRGLAAVKRLNRRLLDARRAVERHSIAPAFEIMRRRDRPLRSQSRFRPDPAPDKSTFATFFRLASNSRSAGAVNAGFHAVITSVFTCPFAISPASSFSASSCGRV